MTAATAWASAARCPSKGAKAALRMLAEFADQEGYAWVTMEYLMVGLETDVERTAQRALADLRGKVDPEHPELGPRMENGHPPLIEEMPRSRWVLHRGRRVPLYRLALEYGPRNIKERLAEDAAAAREVTLVSPQAEPRGDTGVTSGGDADVAREVTLVSPRYSKTQREAESESSTGARAGEDLAVRADFDRTYAAYPPTGTYGRSSRDGEAWPAWLAECAHVASGRGCTEAEASGMLAAAMAVAIGRQAMVGSSGQAKAFHGFLASRRYDAFLGMAPAEPQRIQFAGPGAVWSAIVAANGEEWARSCLLGCDWDAEAGALHPASTWAESRLRQAIRILSQHGVTVGAVRRRQSAA